MGTWENVPGYTNISCRSICFQENLKPETRAFTIEHGSAGWALQTISKLVNVTKTIVYGIFIMV